MAKLAIVVLCCLAGALAVPYKNQRIIGGTVAKPGQFPFQVSIQNDGENLCGGSILSETTILTATSCFMLSDLTLSVIVGTNDLKEGGVVYEVAQIIRHPEFEAYTTLNDIAILKLKAPIKFNENAQPVKLAEAAAKDDVTVVGFGLENILKYLNVKLIGSNFCAALYANVYPNVVIGDAQFCAVSSKNEGACFGEGGTPSLNTDGEQVGVFSFTYVPCLSGLPEVYTAISAYKDWIASV